MLTILLLLPSFGLGDNRGEGRPHPQAIVASILKGDKPVTVKRSNTVMGPPTQPLPRTTPVRGKRDLAEQCEFHHHWKLELFISSCLLFLMSRIVKH